MATTSMPDRAGLPIEEGEAAVSVLDASSRSQLAAVLVALRKDLIACRLQPGTKLPIQALSARYGVSAGAVREALSRLVSEGLVAFNEQRGFRAAPISVAEMVDITRTRILVDLEALRLAIAQGDSDWEGDVLAAYHRLSRQEGTTEAWIQRHHAFHRTLIVVCGSDWLLRFHDVLQGQSERYRRMQAYYRQIGHPESQRDVDAEHEAITRAVLARDAGRATRLLEEHYRATMVKLQLVLPPDTE